MLLLQCFVAFIIVMEFVSLLTNVSSIRLLLRLIYNIYIHMYVFIVYICSYVYIIRYLLLKAAFCFPTANKGYHWHIFYFIKTFAFKWNHFRSWNILVPFYFIIKNLCLSKMLKTSLSNIVWLLFKTSVEFSQIFATWSSVLLENFRSVLGLHCSLITLLLLELTIICATVI